MAELPSLAEVAAKFNQSVAAPAPASPAPNLEPAPRAAIEGVQDAPEAPAAPAEAPEPAPAPVEPEPKRDLSSSKFAALSRKEKEARKVAAEADRKLAEVNQRLQEFEARSAQQQGIKTPLDALEFLRKSGISYDQITAAVLGQPDPTPVDPLDARFKPILDKLGRIDEVDTKLSSTIEEIKQREADIALREVNQAIKETARSGQYEHIQTFGDSAHDMVREVMVEHYNQNKDFLTYEEACDRVEAYYEGMANELLKAKKVQDKFKPAPPAPKPSPTKVKEPTTLTNKVAQGAQASSVDVNKLPRSEAIDYLLRKHGLR